MTDKTPRGRCITTDGYRTWPERGTKTPPRPARAGSDAAMNRPAKVEDEESTVDLNE